MENFIEIKEIVVNNLIGKSRILDYTINPYGGCGVGCVYCYARYIGKVYGRKLSEWGKYVYPKVNSPLVISKDMKHIKGGSIYISSLTDPYQPLEVKYKLTRRILQELLRYHNKLIIVIQTKSTLVLRDLDILKKFKHVKVGFTIICDDKWYKVLEPKASPPSLRIHALKLLHRENISTYAFIGPILPFITDPLDILKKVKDYVDEVYFDKLNIRPGVWRSLKKILKTYGLERNYREIFFKENRKNEYYSRIKSKIIECCKDINVDCNILF